MDEIAREGKTYRYDADYDCYYRVYSREDLSHWETYGWIYVIIVLAVICYLVEL
jgi:hypothetical protein